MYITKPKLTFAARIVNFFECLFCKNKKNCPVSFGNRIKIHYSMPGEFSSDFYHKNLCEKEDRPYRYSIYSERAKKIIFCFITFLFLATGLGSVITKNKILFICFLIIAIIEIIPLIIEYKKL